MDSGSVWKVIRAEEWVPLRDALIEQGKSRRAKETAIHAAIKKWWDAAIIPRGGANFSYIAPVDSGISNAAAVTSPLSSTHICALRDLTEYQQIDMDEKAFYLFYALVKASQEIFVLGGMTRSELCKHFDTNNVDQPVPITLKALGRSINFSSVDLASHGSKLRNMWFWLPFEDPRHPSQQLRMDMSELNADLASYRMKLMLKFWALRNDLNFSDLDSGDYIRILQALHEDEELGIYFDLRTEEGRATELMSFWMLAFVCAHDIRLWDARRYFESRLLYFRVNMYFCKERHFILFIQNNRLMPSQRPEYIRETIDWADVEQREIDLYRLRSPNGPLPTLWLLVPAMSLGREAFACETRDVEHGYTCITYRDFYLWACAQMEYASEKYVRNTMVARVRGPPKAPGWSTPMPAHPLSLKEDLRVHTNTASVVMQILEVAGKDLKLIEEDERIARIRARADALFDGDMKISESLDIGTKETLEAIARRYFPPCIAQHVYVALEKGRHPINLSRVSFVTFLFLAGYTLPEVVKVVMLMYQHDPKFMQSLNGRPWDEKAYMSEVGYEIKGRFKNVVTEKKSGEWGCTHLIQPAVADQPHGCPFARSQDNDAKEILAWLMPVGNTIGDIEDIMGPVSDPREHCIRLYRKKFPNARSRRIMHPLQFVDGLKEEIAHGKGQTMAFVKREMMDDQGGLEMMDISPDQFDQLVEEAKAKLVINDDAGAETSPKKIKV